MASPGALTYEDLIALTKQALGGRNTGLMNDAWYGDRVNSAYSRLCTFQGPVSAPGLSQNNRVIRFFELYDTDSRTISSGLASNFITPIAGADKVVFVDNVFDTTGERQLARKSIRWMMQRDPTHPGEPRSWTPGGQGNPGYFIHPIPGVAGDEVTVQERTYQYPDALSAGESPVIPSAWHAAIWRAAAAEAASLIDWPEKANEMETMFMRFLAERRSPVEESGAAGGRRYFTVGSST